MVLKKAFLYYRTIRHLKPIQCRYRLYYALRSRWRKMRRFQYPYFIPVERAPLRHKKWVHSKKQFHNDEFTFLNRQKKFDEKISWNYDGHGKLWAYNLNYFDYLMQPKMDRSTGLRLIQQFLETIHSNEVGLEPYPISLRNINWIKFCLQHNIDKPKINACIYAQYKILADNLEYHLLGNHLLENGCSLLIGSYYFDDSTFYETACEILYWQLNEQILDDGAHFERSPMYHQILCYRLLDCYNLANFNDRERKQLTELIRQKIERMLGWLLQITFNNETVPGVNDSAEGIAPNTDKLLEYARQLGVNPDYRELNESGYRMVKKPAYELFLDIGEIGPDYIPGHAHSDTFSFLLNAEDNPIIVDTGISTYETGERRDFERSTEAHNTVMVENAEQSEVWKSFRVGRRAHITNVVEKSNTIVAEHDGYAHLGVIHKRAFNWDDYNIIIQDEVIAKKKYLNRAFIHFHPSVKVNKTGDIIKAGEIKLNFKGASQINIKSYMYANTFNSLQKATHLEIRFKDQLQTKILLR